MSGHNGDNQDFRNIMNDVDFLEAQIMETMNASVEFEEHDREHQGMKVRSITLFSVNKTDFCPKDFRPENSIETRDLRDVLNLDHPE